LYTFIQCSGLWSGSPGNGKSFIFSGETAVVFFCGSCGAAVERMFYWSLSRREVAGSFRWYGGRFLDSQERSVDVILPFFYDLGATAL
jgi:hypothetical protein